MLNVLFLNKKKSASPVGQFSLWCSIFMAGVQASRKIHEVSKTRVQHLVFWGAFDLKRKNLPGALAMLCRLAQRSTSRLLITLFLGWSNMMHNNAVVQLIMIWLMKKNPIDRNWIILHYLSQVSISTSVNHCFYLLGFSLMIRIFRSYMV